MQSLFQPRPERFLLAMPWVRTMKLGSVSYDAILMALDKQDVSFKAVEMTGVDQLLTIVPMDVIINILTGLMRSQVQGGGLGLLKQADENGRLSTTKALVHSDLI